MDVRRVDTAGLEEGKRHADIEIGDKRKRLYGLWATVSQLARQWISRWY